jgi:2-dehydro-3-deoxyphosphogluconate aldolase/(4S)-4-hydroxy-2-oxoglutarate aldolase
MKIVSEGRELLQLEEIKAQIISGGIIAIVRGDFRGRLLPMAEVLAEEGVSAIEVTMNSPDALAAIKELAQGVGDRLLVGAGTVIDPDDVNQIAVVGGCFIVAPNVDEAVIKAANEAGLLAIPGAYTATEILKAWHWGADLVKLFPASAGGPGYLKALRGPLSHIPLVPTGGISAGNAAAFMAAGAAALGIGGSLVNPDVLETGGLERLRERARLLMTAVTEGRKGG